MKEHGAEDTEQRSTTEKDPSRERALLRQRTGVPNGDKKRKAQGFTEAEKMKKPLDTGRPR
jgi:hypothetical protein